MKEAPNGERGEQSESTQPPTNPNNSKVPSATSPPNPSDGGALRRRWLHFCLLVILVAVVGVFLLSLRGRLTETTRPHFESLPTWIRHAAVIAICSLLVYLLTRLLKPTLGHLNSIAFRHPPTWCGVALAVFVVFVADQCDVIGPSGNSGKWREWLLYTGVSCGIVRALTWSGRAERPPVPDNTAAPPRTIDELIADPVALGRWLESESPAEEDLLGTRRVARRLARYLFGALDRPRTIGLVGGFGTGKTTMVNWLKSDLEDRTEESALTIWTCEVSCWGFEDSASAAEYILKRAVSTVGEHLDCFAFRNLPESYRKTFSAGGDWVRNISDLLFGATDPLEQFERLSQLLASVPARLVIVIEDLDRNQSTRFDPAEIQALLQRLRNYPSLSFVLTGGRTKSRIDFAKLCERIELMPLLDPDRVLRIVSTFREQSIIRFPDDVLPLAASGTPWNPEPRLLLASYQIGSEAQSLCRLITTPRGLKQTLRHTHLAWETLHGEVDFDHLLALNTLRHEAPEAINFLLANVDELLDDPRRWGSAGRLRAAQERLQEAWGDTTRVVQWSADDALELLIFLLPHAGLYLRGRSEPSGSPIGGSVQGAGRRSHLERMLHEELESDELRDQEVLRDMRDWLASPAEDARLVRRLLELEAYSDSWERFTLGNNQWNGEILLTLMEHLLVALRTDRGTRHGGDAHPGFLSLWRMAIRRVPKNEISYCWLESQVLLAMSGNLPLALDLYYYWATERQGIMPLGGRGRLRTAIHARAQAQFRSSSDLLPVVHPTVPYDLYQLVFPPGDEDSEPSPLRETQDWAWLGPILLAALLEQPRLIAPKIAHLIADRRDYGMRGETRYHTLPDRLMGFFPESVPQLLAGLASARDLLVGREREILDQVIRSAHASPDETK